MTRIHRTLAAGALGAALFLGATAAWAHHEIEAKFDSKNKITLTGVVTSVDWRNPHVHIFMNVKGAPAAAAAKGKAATKGTASGVSNWAIELESPAILALDGWNRDSLQVGDRITVAGWRARDNSRQAWGADVRYTDNNQPVFPAKIKPASKYPLSSRPTPRWPDGHPALGMVPGGEDGYWTDPSKTALVEDGVDVKMDEWGLLANIADAPKVAPMQPWALGVYQNRQQRLLKEDPMYINCKPPGGPRMFQSRLGVQFMEDVKRNRVFLMMGSGNHNYRIIYTDPNRKQVGLQGGDDDNPLYFGRSKGHWEGDTFVVDIVDYNEDFWFTNGGLPHTDKLHLIERFTRTDADTLKYEVTVDDPGAYTRTWKASWTLKWNGGATLPSHFCQNNRQ